MKLHEVITAIVAVYGAALATFTYINQLKYNKPRLKVTIEHSAILMADGKRIDNVICITPRNSGLKTVTLHTVVFELPNKKGGQVPVPSGPVRLPYELLPEKSCTMWVENKPLAELLQSEGFSGKVKIRVWLRDAVGRRYKSNYLEFDVG